MSKKKLRDKKTAARKVAVKTKLAKRREIIRAEAKAAKLLAQLRREISNDESRSDDTSTEGDFLGGNHSPTENRTDV
jgi:hypothetical protein